MTRHDDREWPSEGVEFLDKCPVCGCVLRQKIYEDLIDSVFRCAPGRWTLYRCQACSIAYLDPRPTPSTIGLAYQTYYTHHVLPGRVDFDSLGTLRKVRRLASNSYTNLQYGTQYVPASAFLGRILQAFPGVTTQLDAEFRWLPRPGAGHRLLDVGCGNGSFITKAVSAGWIAMGIDLDSRAVDAAKSLGLDAYVGSLSLLASESESFDAITLSHVIEHVHDPLELLRSIRRLLKPGGLLYVETPNVDSLGARTYRKNWRGLEPPRHLVLFNRRSLDAALHSCGFAVDRSMRRTSVSRGIFLQSENIVSGRQPLDSRARIPWVRRIALAFGAHSKAQDEFITLIARKQYAV